jgi:hypothetical protein
MQKRRRFDADFNAGEEEGVVYVGGGDGTGAAEGIRPTSKAQEAADTDFWL